MYNLVTIASKIRHFRLVLNACKYLRLSYLFIIVVSGLCDICCTVESIEILIYSIPLHCSSYDLSWTMNR